MSSQAHVLAFLLLALCAGCSKAELSEARKTHLLAGDHGWIDLVVKTPPVPRSGDKVTEECVLSLISNGESLLSESADFRAAAVSGAPIGYRFPVSTGVQNLELTFARCSKDNLVLKQRLDIKKDELVELSVQGTALQTGRTTPYQPATLDDVNALSQSLRAHVEALAGATAQSAARSSMLSWLVGVSLFCNALTLLIVLFRRRRT